MKRFFHLFLLSALLLPGLQLVATAVGEDSGLVALSPDDDALQGIEARIVTALNNSFMKRDISYLENIRAEIAEVEAPDQKRLALYWLAYTDFNIAIFKLKSRDATTATKIIGTAISSLDELSEKDAEELTLLAYLQDFYVQFIPKDKQEALSKAAADNVRAALAAEADNMRAQYVFGRINFYDDQDAEVEHSLKQAITLPANKSGKDSLPSWGKAEAYELMVQFYLREQKAPEAKIVLDEALELFPDNYQLSVLVPKVKEASGK